MNVKKVFEKYDETDEFLKFDRVENKLSKRADLNAMLILDKLVDGIIPDKFDMVCSAEHDQIWFYVEPDDLRELASEEQIVDLIRCGVFYDHETDSLSMFV